MGGRDRRGLVERPFGFQGYREIRICCGDGDERWRLHQRQLLRLRLGRRLRRCGGWVHGVGLVGLARRGSRAGALLGAETGSEAC